MVCIAAFIILLVVGIFVAFISIFKPKVGKRYLKTLKKSWGCFGKRVTLQKCETSFGDDVKNTILAKLVLKKPKLVKPVSIGIEVASILVVLITVWSLVEGAKAGLALWTLGTCNVQHPDSCALGAEVCSIDGSGQPTNPIEYVGQWFADWGEIFGAVPDKFRDWNVSNFDFQGLRIKEDGDIDAIDIFDPGCVVCLQSYKAQKESGFFESHNVLLVPYAIPSDDGYKFANSELIVRYIFATEKVESKVKGAGLKIIDRIFMEKDDKHSAYQTNFNDVYSAEKAKEVLQDWLKEFGYSDDEIKKIDELAQTDEISEIFKHHDDLIKNNIHAKGIPTMIFDGRKHTGKFEAN